jgi:fumarate reductase flavoprotein subunit
MEESMKKSNIIATIIFVLLSIACIIAITTCSKTPTIQDGIWTGSGEGFKGEMIIQITTKDGKIVDTELLSIKDSDFAKEYALQLLDVIEDKGTVEGVDALSGATYTSRGVLDAVKQATEKASK